jgi:signal transduction histidine kinase
LDALDGERIVPYVADKSLPADHGQITSLFEDHAGRLWVGMDLSLFIFEDRHFRELKKPNGDTLGLVVGMTEDTENNVWVEVSGQTRTLVRFRDLSYQEDYPDPKVPGGRRVTADPAGGIWLGLITGDLARFRDGHVDTFAFHHPRDLRGVEQVTVAPDGLVLGATAFGLVAWSNGNLLSMTVANGLPCDQIFSFMFDDAGALWLNSQCGLVRISAADLHNWREEPSSRLRLQTYDALDGVQLGFQAKFGASGKSPDGRLWYVQNQVLQTFDPKHFSQNSQPPPVHIEAVIADRTSYPTRNGLSLPALTRDIEIDYTALSFVVPQRVRSRYKLVGRDKEWQDPGTRRQAFYGDLPPGKYIFHVIACNNDGVWNDEGATLEFRVAPAWYQTQTFLIAACAGGLFCIWGIYRLRLHQLAVSIARRLDERVAERNRLARDLHDTLLQTIQGTKHLVDAALDAADDPSAMRRTMERLSDWLGRATEEGRAALKALRTSTATTNTLADSFRIALEECQTSGVPAIDLAIEGSSKNLNPIVRDEVYRFGFEAIQNAARHAKANRLNVRLVYGRDFTLTVTDDGRGMSADILVSGKEGHYGLKGMRERAQQIGGECFIASSAKLGTRIALTVPGPAIYSREEGKMRKLLSALQRRLDFERPRD